MMLQRPSVVVPSVERTFFDQKLVARRRPFTSFSGGGRWGAGIAVAFSCFLLLLARLLPEMERTSDLSGARNSLRGFAGVIEGCRCWATTVEGILRMVMGGRRERRWKETKGVDDA